MQLLIIMDKKEYEREMTKSRVVERVLPDKLFDSDNLQFIKARLTIKQLQKMIEYSAINELEECRKLDQADNEKYLESLKRSKL